MGLLRLVPVPYESQAEEPLGTKSPNSAKDLVSTVVATASFVLLGLKACLSEASRIYPLTWQILACLRPPLVNHFPQPLAKGCRLSGEMMGSISSGSKQHQVCREGRRNKLENLNCIRLSSLCTSEAQKSGQTQINIPDK